MNSSEGTTLSERTERVTGIGEPRPPSRGALTLAALFSAFFVGALAWYALFGGWQDDGGGYAMVGGTLLRLWLASDKLGSYLFARREVPWGRGLRDRGLLPPRDGLLPGGLLDRLDRPVRGAVGGPRDRVRLGHPPPRETGEGSSARLTRGSEATPSGC